jgi:hypothetical protein
LSLKPREVSLFKSEKKDGMVPVISVAVITNEVRLVKVDKEVGILPNFVPEISRDVNEIGRSEIPVNSLPMISNDDRLVGREGKVAEKNYHECQSELSLSKQK